MTIQTPLDSFQTRIGMEGGDPGLRRPRKRTLALAGLAAALLAGLSWQVFGDSSAEAAPPPVPEVTTAAPIVREVTEWDDYIGRFAPSEMVEVRPRVSGAITAIHFRDGDFVRKGQPLFTVDPRPYRAALTEARADVAAAQSALALAQSDYDRVAGLTGDEAMAESEVEQLQTRVRSARAALAAARARADRRALDVQFATVRAPISGQISDRRIDVGNLVSGENGAGATLLTTINTIDPIYFAFDASEALYLKTRRQSEGGNDAARVQVRLQDEADYRWEGELDFTDNALNPNSGTIRARALFRNPDGFLRPGMFGDMRLADAGTARALLIPDAAVQSDQARKVVLTVGKDDVVTAKPVEPGPLVQGLRVIRSGLLPGDRVVISNFAEAVAGSKVDSRRGQIAFARGDAARPPSPGEPVAAQATIAE
jgi:RND family efflux transporter MFP subunit